MFRLVRSWALLAGIFLVFWTPAPSPSFAADSPVKVTVLTPIVPLGGTLFLLIDAPGAAAVRVRVGDARLPAYPRPDGRWEAVAGIGVEQIPGNHAISVETIIDNQPLAAHAGFTVAKRTFPTQHLHLSRAANAKYAAPSIQDEYRLIGAALGRETPVRAWQGGFRLPVAGRISTQFGQQRYRNGKRVDMHKGLDIAAAKGTPVYAANAGTVVLVRKLGLHGHTVVIDHGGGVAGLYLHLSTFDVVEGQQVAAGQQIARVGATGVATGPHLHYALYVHGIAVDPLFWKQVPL